MISKFVILTLNCYNFRYGILNVKHCWWYGYTKVSGIELSKRPFPSITFPNVCPQGSSSQFYSWSGQKFLRTFRRWLRSVATRISQPDLLISAARIPLFPIFPQIVDGFKTNLVKVSMQIYIIWNFHAIIQHKKWDEKRQKPAMRGMTLLRPMRW